MATPIIFDTDPGIDDAMAIVFAHLHPDIDLLGLTTVRGNASVALTTRNALHLLERFDLGCEVHRGADRALVVPTGPVPDFVHGADGLGNLKPPTPTIDAHSNDAAGYIVRTLRERPGEVTLVAVGRMTNLAHALERDPDVASLARQVVIMGGALSCAGNVSPCAEANIAGDPHAADLVLGAAWPVVMVGLDVTLSVIMDDARMQRIRNGGGAAGQFVWDVSRYYANFYASHGFEHGFPVHDSSALSYVVSPEHYTLQRGAIRVVSEGLAIGQTIQKPADKSFPPGAWDTLPEQAGAIAVDADALLDQYESVLCRAR